MRKVFWFGIKVRHVISLVTLLIFLSLVCLRAEESTKLAIPVEVDSKLLGNTWQEIIGSISNLEIYRFNIDQTPSPKVDPLVPRDGLCRYYSDPVRLLLFSFSKAKVQGILYSARLDQQQIQQLVDEAKSKYGKDPIRSSDVPNVGYEIYLWKKDENLVSLCVPTQNTIGDSTLRIVTLPFADEIGIKH